ncbi:bifunctional 5,10-methylenetetrahydrofolate dehydrogenase/5,10-methenyltetrahydrofolate cyclohydrolase [uncultured Secundilactobacillus sp.]|uniref:bifunctional 5,10-methylenetetrahydrofolate dehydrogenase/5,10-methenyltetrahydrofolate cyclohydrolase n=1 Tax=uncultured Secundilactobacillus sp. TaxID=2813935 RepID=UPI00258CC470|nr:tetrahydrofolate dehydrogenase/cyclohydrolase catalytic domain-containing protein [uncultured Secundilactobacillus sp.]
MATLIDGKKLANELNEQTKQAVETLSAKGVQPGLAVIIVGEDPASQLYVRNKHRKAAQLGIHSVVKQLPADITQAELLAVVRQLNSDSSIHGILVQSPLPEPLDEHEVTRTISPEKDVDGFHPLNVGLLYTNMKLQYPVACTPKGIMTMLAAYDVPLSGKHAVVVGRSNIVGRPMTALLMQADATVTIANRHTENLKSLTRQADILVVATGVAHLIKAADVKPGATVIDVGMDRDENGKLTGDVDFEAVSQVAGKITPVPGGVGPMTIATLMQQTVELAKWSETSGS